MEEAGNQSTLPVSPRFLFTAVPLFELNTIQLRETLCGNIAIPSRFKNHYEGN